MAVYEIGKDVKVVDGKHETVFVTKPSMITNQVHTVCIGGVNANQVAQWLTDRMAGTAALVQDAFPMLTNGEREFLMTGITEEEWAKFMKDDEENKGD